MIVLWKQCGSALGYILDLLSGKHKYIVSVTVQEVIGKINSDLGPQMTALAMAAHIINETAVLPEFTVAGQNEENGVPGRLQPQQTLSPQPTPGLPLWTLIIPVGFKSNFPVLKMDGIF